MSEVNNDKDKKTVNCYKRRLFKICDCGRSLLPTGLYIYLSFLHLSSYVLFVLSFRKFVHVVNNLVVMKYVF